MVHYQDCVEIVKQLENKDVLIEFIHHSPTSLSEGAFAKGRLNSQLSPTTENVSIKLIITNSEIQVPYQDIKVITPL